MLPDLLPSPLRIPTNLKEEYENRQGPGGQSTQKAQLWIIQLEHGNSCVTLFFPMLSAVIEVCGHMHIHICTYLYIYIICDMHTYAYLSSYNSFWMSVSFIMFLLTFKYYKIISHLTKRS